MNQEEEKIKIYSEEVRDILSHPPSSIFRWGNTILLFFVILLFAISWFIKYPDIVSSEIKITTVIPPERLKSKVTGKIQEIFISDQSQIESNMPLAIIENSSNYQDVFYLKEILERLNHDLNYELPIERLSRLQLGDIETAYSNFEKDYLAYEINKDLLPHLIDKQTQQVESNEQSQRLNLLISQKEISKKELNYKKTELNRFKTLFDRGVISMQEWESKNIELLQKEKDLNNLETQISNIRSSLNTLSKDKKSTNLNEIKDRITLERNLNLSLNQLKKAINDWELNYVIKSSINGKITFLKIWSKSQNISLGEDVFVIIPNNSGDYVGKIKASVRNSGKIKIGQLVNIRLSNYPEREFGMLKGIVNSISLVPDNEDNLIIDVDLPNGLETTYKKEVIFQQEMSGTADVITKDLRLIERLLYQFRDLFSRNETF